MARNMQPIVKLSRREGYALHPKAHKALVKRAAPPAQQGRGRRPKASQYSLQLREKQKVKRLYGLLERQFAKLMKEAGKSRGQSGTVLLQLLERRADNAVYRAGFAASRQAARQLVSHGHWLLNGQRINVPSLRLKPGDVLRVRDHSLKTVYFQKLDEVSPAINQTYSWLTIDRKKGQITISGSPTREETDPDINEQLIVEYYSR